MAIVWIALYKFPSLIKALADALYVLKELITPGKNVFLVNQAALSSAISILSATSVRILSTLMLRRWLVSKPAKESLSKEATIMDFDFVDRPRMNL